MGGKTNWLRCVAGYCLPAYKPSSASRPNCGARASMGLSSNPSTPPQGAPACLLACQPARSTGDQHAP
eukprot:11124894-Alexandrium_andersonii.AAC.1